MRRLLVTLVTLLALPVAAQQLPADLQPLPEPPPPPPGMADPSLEPQVVITKRGEDRVEEYRLNGKLYMLKVTPPSGPSYYLIDERGDGKMTRQETLDSGLRVPMWVIGTF
ncbi:MAG: DUF2782 domain-containing protein [Sterolibacterium sp.]|nr:DUF2782 domain-containing protein [Sterolibacterium sp.]MBP9801010.1 DUF2782 domain-containing protein [Sterolibacterium sp.]